MSPASDQLFNIWFPAIVGGLFLGLLAAALWDILRRKTWTFASRFWPGVLKEVVLDHPSLSRTEVEERQRQVTEMLSALSSQISRALVKPPDKSFMAEATDSTVAGSSNSSKDYDIEAQTGINPLCPPTLKPITFTATAYFPDDTPIFVVRRTNTVFKRYARGTIKGWKSSIVVQASLPVDPCVLAEIGELAKDCMHVENRCTFQLGNWAILYYNAGKIHSRALMEGDVPVNVEARWQEEVCPGAGITMCGLYLNGAQVKVATEKTSTTLRDDGPAAQGPGDLDELFFPIEGLDVPGDDSLVYAAKVVEADGVSLTVRSEASCILPPREKSFREIIWGRLQWIPLSTKKMIKSLLKIENRHSETISSGRDLESDLEHFELLAEHWKGVSEIELLDNRKEVLYYFHELSGFEIGECAGPQASHPFTRTSIGDQYYSKYWQRGLQDLNEVILLWNCPQNTDGLQSALHISIRGGIKFLLGDFEGALQDFDLAYNNLNTGGHRSTLLLDRALAKCMLARYSEAMQDILAVIAINPNLNDIQELQTWLPQILNQLSFRRVQYGPLSQRPQLSDQYNSVPIIPDLLTGDEWNSAPEDVAPPFGQLSNRVTRACAPPSDDLTKFRDVNMREGGQQVGDFSRHLQGEDTLLLQRSNQGLVSRCYSCGSVVKSEFFNACIECRELYQDVKPGEVKVPLLLEPASWIAPENIPSAPIAETVPEDHVAIPFPSPSTRVTRPKPPPSDDSSRDHHARSPRRSPTSPYRTLQSQRGRPPNGSRQGPPGFKGVRQRKGVRGYLVEIRPPKWKRTIWLGTYNTDREAAGAYDAGIYYTNKKTKYNFPHLEWTFPPLPSQLRLDNPDDSEEIKTFVQKEARLAAQKVKSLPSAETGAASLSTESSARNVAPIAIPLDEEWYHNEIHTSSFDDMVCNVSFQKGGSPQQAASRHMDPSLDQKQEEISSGEEFSECHETEGNTGGCQSGIQETTHFGVFHQPCKHEQHTSELAMEID